MSQRFLRCIHCGLPHSIEETVCAITGRPIEVRRRKLEGRLAPAAMPVIPPMPVPTAMPPIAASVLRASTPKLPNSAPTRPQQPSEPMSGPRVHRSEAPAPFEDSAASPSIIGQVLGGKYRALRVIGEGGMGTVFECEHIQLHRKVAAKVLHAAHTKKKASVARFQNEAHVVGAIGHPNICEIYDMGELDDGSPFLVMELLLGETLADRISSEGALPFDDVIEVIAQVLSGLVAAHEKGIIHRDIKPENVFLTKRTGIGPMVKLLDFGISKMMQGMGGEELNLTRTGMVMGTPFYMSPEQARGDRNLDQRVDIYAAGVMTYECLTGRRPFTAANYNALLIQILTTSARPMSELRPAIPIGFEQVVAKAMQRDRSKRFSNAIEMQRDVIALRDPGGARRLASIPPEPVPLVTQRREPRKESQREAPRPVELRRAPPNEAREVAREIVREAPRERDVDRSVEALRAPRAFDAPPASSRGLVDRADERAVRPDEVPRSNRGHQNEPPREAPRPMREPPRTDPLTELPAISVDLEAIGDTEFGSVEIPIVAEPPRRTVPPPLPTQPRMFPPTPAMPRDMAPDVPQNVSRELRDSRALSHPSQAESKSANIPLRPSYQPPPPRRNSTATPPPPRSESVRPPSVVPAAVAAAMDAPWLHDDHGEDEDPTEIGMVLGSLGSGLDADATERIPPDALRRLEQLIPKVKSRPQRESQRDKTPLPAQAAEAPMDAADDDPTTVFDRRAFEQRVDRKHTPTPSRRRRSPSGSNSALMKNTTERAPAPTPSMGQAPESAVPAPASVPKFPRPKGR